LATGAQAAFFSYSREDSEFAVRLAEDLKAAGANVWLDQLDIEAGTLWDREVQKALAICPRMLVILSPTSVNSDNVLDEVSFALSKQKRVIPVLYRECDIPFRLARVQYIDFRTDYARGLKALLSTLGVEQLPEQERGRGPILAEPPSYQTPSGTALYQDGGVADRKKISDRISRAFSGSSKRAKIVVAACVVLIVSSVLCWALVDRFHNNVAIQRVVV
jgi:TIR domain